jgi:GT2 family glycosyltransferase
MSTFIPWKILHLELSESIPPLPATPDCQGIYLVFWWYGIPLGHQEIPAAQLPMPATQLLNSVVQIIAPAVGDRLLLQDKNRSPDWHSQVGVKNPLKQLRECWSNPVDELVSVVICTRDRPQELAECLRSLQNLSHHPQEIIVVDNAPSTEATCQLVSQMPGVRYVPEPRPGLSVARNTGIRHSIGKIIAFTDDDVTVHPNWIVQLQQSFQNPQVMAVTGLVIPAELETESQVIFEMNHGCLSGEYHAKTFDQEFFQATKHRGVPVWTIGAGANMAFRREIFQQVGDFDERLGAGASGCSEDSEFWYRVLAQGWLCHYEPTAVVFHYHRRELDSLKQQMYQYMRGHNVALLIQFARYKHWGNLLRLFVILPVYYVLVLLKGSIGGFGLRHRTYLAEVWGCLAGIKFYLQNRVSGKRLPNIS